MTADPSLLETDRQMRAILAEVTKETTLSSMQALVDLGLSPRTALVLVEETLRHLPKVKP